MGRPCAGLKRSRQVVLVSLTTLSSISLVQEALLSFALDSAGGLLGLPPQHIKGAFTPGERDELMRALHSVVSILSKDQVPGSIVSCITSASLAALKKDRKHSPVAVARTLRRLTAKALLAAVTEDMTPTCNPRSWDLEHSTAAPSSSPSTDGQAATRPTETATVQRAAQRRRVGEVPAPLQVSLTIFKESFIESGNIGGIKVTVPYNTGRNTSR